MVSVLQSLGQSGQLETDLPAQRGKERGGHLTISVKDGHILYWQLTTAQGLATSGREAELRPLSRSYQMRLHWHFSPLRPSGATNTGSFSQYSPARPPTVITQPLSNALPAQSSPSQSSPAWSSPSQSSPAWENYNSINGDQRIPQRLQLILSDKLAEMPRRYRAVYALVNGANSVEHIARLLPSMDRQSIITILQELANRSLIRW
jgi:hypothetical protein